MNNFQYTPERNSSIGAAMETVAEIWVKRTSSAGRRLENGKLKDKKLLYTKRNTESFNLARQNSLALKVFEESRGTKHGKQSRLHF